MYTALGLSILATLAAAPSKPTEAPAERPWTLMVYGAADNDADGPILEFLDGVRRTLDDDPGMELILFIDRSEGYSKDASSLGADFTGARIVVFGAIRGGPETQKGYDVAVVVQGPEQDVIVRRKERVLGIWANRTSRAFTGVRFLRIRLHRPRGRGGISVAVANPDSSPGSTS